jgi:pimeloyl-ACP methyl ester carboxylesterase
MTDQHPPVLGHSVFGQGPERVLVLHDWMGDAANYEPLLPHLDPTTHTYVFADVRGYGRSRHLAGEFSVGEVATDVFHLADHLGWFQYHVIGHSMTGMVVQCMALHDHLAGHGRLRSIVAITPVAADGYPADAPTKQFLWNLIGDRGLSEQGFSLLTGQRLSPSWARMKTDRHLRTSTPEALQGYYRMWLETDFSAVARAAHITIPMLVIGGRQDLPGFQEAHLRATFGAWYTNVEFAFVTDAGHYPMHEAPIYLATLIERFIGAHRGINPAEHCERDAVAC